MGLRADQVALTRRTIIDTVVDLSADPSGGPITVAAVARRSGISPATIYRHFPNREALVSAAATDRVLLGVSTGTGALSLDDQRAHTLALWSTLAGNLALTRQGAVSEAGRELRKARFDSYKPLFDRALEAAGVDPTSQDARRASACAHLLGSAFSFLDLHDRQGLSVAEAVDTVRWGTEVLLRALGLEPAEFRIPIDRPGAPEEDVA